MFNCIITRNIWILNPMKVSIIVFQKEAVFITGHQKYEHCLKLQLFQLVPKPIFSKLSFPTQLPFDKQEKRLFKTSNEHSIGFLVLTYCSTTCYIKTILNSILFYILTISKHSSDAVLVSPSGLRVQFRQRFIDW